MNSTAEEDLLVPVQLRDILAPSEIKLYRRPIAWRQVVDFGLIWLQILIGIGVFVWSPGILTYILAALLISGGQHGLGLVAHEFLHYNVLPENRKLNDFLGTWLFAAPGGIPFRIFRYRHFLHHRHYSTDQDTKTIYRIDIRGMKLWPEILKRLFLFEYFNHVVAVVRSVKNDPKTHTAGPTLIETLPPLIVTHAVIFAALWAIHPLAYFFLWLAPLLTLQMLFFNFRAITEHQPLRSPAGRSDSPYFLGTVGPFVRTAGASLMDRLFLCKINFGYHAEHHLWPQINYQYLPAVHDRLIERNVFSDSRFGLEQSFTSSIFKLVRQPTDDDRSWYARPVTHGISKVDVPLCPLCGSPRKRPRCGVQEHEYDNTTDDRFHMVECLECSAWYLNPRPADSELGTIYPPNYYSNLLEAGSMVDPVSAEKGVFHRLTLWLFKRRIRPIEKHVQFTPHTRWLDIGCGSGTALESMRQVHGIQGVGVDMSEHAVSICRQRGFEAYATRIEDFTPSSAPKFHFIHSSHLIEHVGDPLAYLVKIYDLLEPGGITIFITPNTKTWESSLFRQHWGGLHVPRHWVLFNSTSAIRAARRAGFEHLETCYSTNSQFWIWSLHSLLLTYLPRKLCDFMFPSDHRFVKSSIGVVLRGGLFTAVDMLTVLCTGRSSNMGVILRKPLQ